MAGAARNPRIKSGLTDNLAHAELRLDAYRSTLGYEHFFLLLFQRTETERRCVPFKKRNLLRERRRTLCDSPNASSISNKGVETLNR